MPELGGIDHLSLTVTDLDRSERFYTEVFDLIRLADFGTTRILQQRRTSFMLALVHHDDAYGGRCSKRHTGLDHVGFAVDSLDELVDWQHRLESLDVEHLPIRDLGFGTHLIFRDPDGIALELSTSNEVLSGWLEELQERDIPRDEIDLRLGAYLASLP